jgi:hypothetical protein
MVGGLEHLLADGCLGHHGLDEAAAIAQDQEMDFSARAAIVQPAVNGDFLALVATDVLNVGIHISR